jgi:hypothetical protein
METQMSVTGAIQESGVVQIRETLWQPAAEPRPSTTPRTIDSVLEQGSSVIAPGVPLPLSR